MTRARRRLVFYALCPLPTVALACAIPAIWCAARGGDPRLGAPPMTAWQASFLERGLALPERPRRGWWIDQRTPHVPDPILGWRLAENTDPEWQVDADGMMHFGGPGRARILFTGGSVAVGLGASSRAACWASQLAERLGEPIDVFAACAWRADQEALAIGRTRRYERVVMLTGLNDLTVGDSPTARFSGMNVIGDVRARERVFLARVAIARELARPAELTVAIQPFREGKVGLSSMEQRLGFGRDEDLRDGQGGLILGLASNGVHQVLLADVFDGEPTTFIDGWHFSDPGHSLLAGRLARALR